MVIRTFAQIFASGAWLVVTAAAMAAPSTLGNYPDTSVILSADATVTPDAIPSDTTTINVSASINFAGELEANPATGVVRVTNAHPAGAYTVTVRAFNARALTATKTFTLTVTTPATCPQVTFTRAGIFPVSYSPRDVVVGDFNRDGIQDLATVHPSSNQTSLSTLLGSGNGQFGTTTANSNGDHASIAVGDFNGDGNQDLVTNEFFSSGKIFLGDGVGHFGPVISFDAAGHIWAVAVGDFNGDGKHDVAATKINSSAAVAVVLGDGMGNFSAPTLLGPGDNHSFLSIVVGDFNADGKQDLAATNHIAGNVSTAGNVSIFLGDGAGNFSTATNFGVDTQPYSVAVGDFNADGKQDLAVANYYSADVSILLGNGSGAFSPATNFLAGGGPKSVAVGDFNADGKQDLVVANSATKNASILLGDGNGGFSAPIYLSGISTNGGEPTSVVVGDFNGDGQQDLAVPAAFGFEAHDVTILLRDCAAPTPTPTPSGTPGPATHFLLTAPSSVPIGSPFPLQVTAKDQFNNTATGYSGTVHFTISGSTAYPNSPLPNGTQTFSMGVSHVGPQSFTATDTSDPSITGTTTVTGYDNKHTPTPTPTPVGSPSPSPTASASPSPSPTASASASPSPSPTASASPLPTGTIAPPASAQSLNLSSRLLVQTGDGVGIAGLIISGSEPKRVIVRAVHCQVCIPEISPLSDPVLELHPAGGAPPILNHNWRDTQEAEIIGTGLAPDNNSDSAMIVTLPPGNHTAILRGEDNTSGVALVEVYDLNPAAASKLANISTRAFVSTGGDILIAGFILGNGTLPDNLIIRGIGPSLGGFGVANALADPRLELRDSHGTLIRTNNNWQDDPAQAALISAAGLAPTNSLESAMAVALSPGQYTALLEGANNGTGVGLVEVYDLGNQ